VIDKNTSFNPQPDHHIFPWGDHGFPWHISLEAALKNRASSQVVLTDTDLEVIRRIRQRTGKNCGGYLPKQCEKVDINVEFHVDISFRFFD